MRILVATLLAVAACGGPKTKHESSIVSEGSDTPPTCCCKTIPETAEKEIIPNYAMIGRMDCSTRQGECVPDVQCNGSQPPPDQTPAKSGNGVPPPPVLAPSKGD
jgi:hypothetical protein